MTSMYTLHDSDTGDLIGPATDEQLVASIAAGPEGHILVDGNGQVVRPGTWSAQRPSVRRVYVIGEGPR